MIEDKKLGVFEKYLTLWIALCIGAGLLLGRFVPAFGEYQQNLTYFEKE